MSPGDKETLSVWRDGKSVDLKVVIGGNEGETKQVAAEKSEPNQPSIGVGLANLTPDIRERLNLPADAKGVAVASVNPDKPAADAGIQTGDIILSVNSKSVNSADEVKEAVGEVAKSGRKSILLQIERDGKKTFVAVPFAAS
jgi:serine protease Do